MSRKQKHEEHENHERWLVSYADFITLLFAFFTVLYATAQTDEEKLQAVVDALNVAFTGGMPHAVFQNTPKPPLSSGLLDTQITTQSDSQISVESMRRGLRGSLSDNVVQIGMVNQSLNVVLPERIAFAAGSAELHPSAYGVLTEVAGVVKSTPAIIQVIGHADGVPVKPSSPFKDNWGLASARAVAAVRYLEKQGVPTEQLVASASITAEKQAEARAVTIRIDLDVPGLAHVLTDSLDKKGLIKAPGE
ncbi:MAG: flagellar motor protein MotB [Myxococcota bacterium]